MPEDREGRGVDDGRGVWVYPTPVDETLVVFSGWTGPTSKGAC